MACVVLVAPSALGDDKAGVIDVSGAKRGDYPIAIPLAVDSDGAAAKEAQDVASFDMSIAGFFKVLDPQSFLADLKAEGMGIDPPKWKDVGAYGVMKFKVAVSGDDVTLDAKLYEVSKGANAVLDKKYNGKRGDLRRLVHAWCNEVVFYYTKEQGFFGSQIVFVAKGKGKSSIQAMDFDGHGVYALTHNDSINMLPSFSHDGGRVAFTSYMRNNPDMYIVNAGGGRPKKISAQRGMNTGASWSPDGSQLAITLSKDGNPDIYIISASDGSIVKRLTNDKAIDTSPSWSPDGSQIAFVSDREGGPQIFVMSASGGSATRVSKNGDYNTTPAWSPKKGAHVLAYTTRDGGVYDIVTLDLDTKKMTRITQGEGSNEEPAFSPNGRAIAFASTRSGGSGIYIANADGTGTAKKVWGGSATGVDWGPTP
ncbi:MAG TPA: Tol-Pal system beta propeller repeat protein TolB [Kofleriaceae bacterium]|nr:Tol-Pal system beta propeller repeat protein TolB [Kofleriaceae bacterium]